MLKEQIKDCKRIVKINKNDTVILFDVSVYLMDCHITKFDVQLIKPIESRITINDFRLESDELLSEHRGQKKNERSNFVYAYQDVEKIKVNHRYHNKRYYTLSAMKGRQVSKCGIPIVIPNGINTDDCKIEIRCLSQNDGYILNSFDKNSNFKNKPEITICSGLKTSNVEVTRAELALYETGELENINER